MSIDRKTLDERQILRLGRTLRRISRTTSDLMRDLDIREDDIRIPRKKRKPKAPSTNRQTD